MDRGAAAADSAPHCFYCAYSDFIGDLLGPPSWQLDIILGSHERRWGFSIPSAVIII